MIKTYYLEKICLNIHFPGFKILYRFTVHVATYFLIGRAFVEFIQRLNVQLFAINEIDVVNQNPSTKTAH
jgi:hypothetical protein